MITESQLKELVKHIVKEIVNEYNAMDMENEDEDDVNMSGGAPVTNPPSVAMSVSDQQKMKQLKDKQRTVNLKAQKTELDTAKKKLDYTKRDQDQIKCIEIPSLQKSVQQLSHPSTTQF